MINSTLIFCLFLPPVLCLYDGLFLYPSNQVDGGESGQRPVYRLINRSIQMPQTAEKNGRPSGVSGGKTSRRSIGLKKNSLNDMEEVYSAFRDMQTVEAQDFEVNGNDPPPKPDERRTEDGGLANGSVVQIVKKMRSLLNELEGDIGLDGRKPKGEESQVEHQTSPARKTIDAFRGFGLGLERPTADLEDGGGSSNTAAFLQSYLVGSADGGQEQVGDGQTDRQQAVQSRDSSPQLYRVQNSPPHASGAQGANSPLLALIVPNRPSSDPTSMYRMVSLPSGNGAQLF